MSNDAPGRTPSDAALVATCNDGEPAAAMRAFETLYERHKPFVLRVALNVLHDHNLALDALQETFASLLTRFPPKGEGLELRAKFTSFLYPVARNAAISQLRKARQARPDDAADPDELAFVSPDPDSDLERLLARLSLERREIVVLRFILDLPMADIAEALEIPVGTAKSRLHAAVTDLRNSPETKRFFEK
ncbi:MAG: sigma-70 family RNA polymerase sigma factor [Woeseiaceae bacterium]|nr:sigma-70 family RNA polymerase sigma factor [Woeseiaceae bacterium]